MDRPMAGPSSRRDFLRRSALVGGTAFAVPTIVTVIANPANAASEVTTTTPTTGQQSTTTQPFRTFDSTTTTTAGSSTTTVGGSSTTTTEGAAVLPEVIEQPPTGAQQSNADEVLARTGMDPTGLLVAGTGLAAAGTVLRVWSARERGGSVGTPDAEPIIATDG